MADDTPVMPAAARRPRARIAGVVIAVALVAISGMLLQRAEHARASQRDARESHRPIAVQSGGYVSSNECRSCHPSEYASWHASYHRAMTQLAEPANVLGDFSGVALGDGPYYRLERQRDRFVFARAEQWTSRYERHSIALVTGSHHMQIYWYETGDARKLGQVPYVYLTADQRWVPRAAVFLEPPTPLRRPDESGRWSYSCIACHATQGQPRMMEEGGNTRFDTHVAELGIACEACHGPGAEHVAKNGSPLTRYAQHIGDAPDRSIVQPARLDHRRASEICSQCHSLWQDNDQQAFSDWNMHGFAYRPGADAAANRWLLQPSARERDKRVDVAMKREPRYVSGQFWSDGMARVSGREYSGMIDSPCYEPSQLSCLSCHQMHKRADDPRSVGVWADDQLKADMGGDRACTQCHAQLASEPALAAHTHHAPASDGSRCYNCHMPNTSYGLLKAMRSHRISVPSARETVETGRPNACNLCHVDKSLGWTASQLHAQYGSPELQLDDDAREQPFALWMGLTGAAGQRALIAGALGWAPAQRASHTEQLPALLGVLMDDPYDAVRYMAVRSLRSLPGLANAAPDYDFVTRPETRPPFAGAPPTAAFARLLRQRDQRPVLLLE